MSENKEDIRYIGGDLPRKSDGILSNLVSLSLGKIESSCDGLFDESDDVMTDQWIIKKELSPIAILLLSKKLNTAIKLLRSADRMLKWEKASDKQRLLMEQEDKLELLIERSSKIDLVVDR